MKLFRLPPLILLVFLQFPLLDLGAYPYERAMEASPIYSLPRITMRDLPLATNSYDTNLEWEHFELEKYPWLSARSSRMDDTFEIFYSTTPETDVTQSSHEQMNLSCGVNYFNSTGKVSRLTPSDYLGIQYSVLSDDLQKGSSTNWEYAATLYSVVGRIWMNDHWMVSSSLGFGEWSNDYGDEDSSGDIRDFEFDTLYRPSDTYYGVGGYEIYWREEPQDQMVSLHFNLVRDFVLLYPRILIGNNVYMYRWESDERPTWDDEIWLSMDWNIITIRTSLRKPLNGTFSDEHVVPFFQVEYCPSARSSLRVSASQGYWKVNDVIDTPWSWSCGGSVRW